MPWRAGSISLLLEYERGWQGRPTQDRGMRLARILRGVEEVRNLDGAMLRSGEARRTGMLTQSLQDTLQRPVHIGAQRSGAGGQWPPHAAERDFGRG